MSLHTYSPEDITILLAGLIPMEGFVEGTFVSVQKDILPFETSHTADGSTSRIHRPSASYTLRLALMATSPTNDVLNKLLQLDELTKKGKFPILIKDQLGTSFFFSATSWVEAPPNLTFDSGIGERDWLIKCSQAAINIGGNDSQSGLVEDLINTAISIAPSYAGML